MKSHTSKHAQLIVKQFIIKKFMFQNVFLHVAMRCVHKFKAQIIKSSKENTI